MQTSTQDPETQVNHPSALPPGVKPKQIVPQNLPPKPGQPQMIVQQQERILHNVTETLELRINSPSEAEVLVRDVIRIYRTMENFGLKNLWIEVARENAQQILTLLGNTFKKYPVHIGYREVFKGTHMLYTPAPYKAVMDAPATRPPAPVRETAAPVPPGKQRAAAAQAPEEAPAAAKQAKVSRQLSKGNDDF